MGATQEKATQSQQEKIQQSEQQISNKDQQVPVDKKDENPEEKQEENLKKDQEIPVNKEDKNTEVEKEEVKEQQEKDSEDKQMEENSKKGQEIPVFQDKNEEIVQVKTEEQKEKNSEIRKGARGSYSVKQTNLSQEVIDYILNEDIFTCKEEELELGEFNRCVDYYSIPDHIYYEGYFHAKNSKDSVESKNPRTGRLFQKQAAPSRLRALMNCIKKKNSEFFKGLDAKVDNETISQLIKDDCFLSDLSVQVHFGDPIEKCGYHIDADNSIFHMALSLQGKRSLYEKYKDEKELEHTDSTVQEKGNVYVTLPATFLHGVTYTECKWENRIIAIQCRLLYDNEQAYKLKQTMQQVGKAVITKKIAEFLRENPIQMPSLEEVQDFEKNYLK